MSFEQTKTSIALGTFDGLHAGHMRVLTCAANAREDEQPTALLFREHPHMALFGSAPKQLITLTEETRLLKSVGIVPEYIDFTDIMNLGCEDFVSLLVCKYGARQLSCGFNYRFGKDAVGDCHTLRILCEDAGIRLRIAHPAEFLGEPISSTRIRASLEDGDIPSANEMLERYFSYDFTVVHGKNLGEKIGLPTINQLFPENFCVPLCGVYASFTEVKDILYPSVTNIGSCPTVNGENVHSETHIVGFSGDLYSQNIRVSLMQRLRPEHKFESTDDLKAQIQCDAQSASEIYEKRLNT